MVEVQGNRARFRFYRPQARSVRVVGSFNGWQEDELRMTHGADGWWHASLLLPPGNHRFRYLADGQWFTDYAAFGVVQGPYGLESVVCVEARAAKPDKAGAKAH